MSMREFSNHAVLSMSDWTMAVSSKYTQDLSVQIIFLTFSCKWFLCFYFWAVIWSYIVDLFAALHELASAIARTLLKLALSVRALLKPYGDTLIMLPPVYHNMEQVLTMCEINRICRQKVRDKYFLVRPFHVKITPRRTLKFLTRKTHHGLDQKSTPTKMV